MMFARTVGSVTVVLAMIAALGGLGCASEVDDDADSSIGALEDQSAEKAASALRALLANPDKLTLGSAPVATVDDFTFYAQPSAVSFEKKASPSADEPINEFVGINPDGEILYVNVATGGVAGVSPGKDIRKTLSKSSFNTIRPQGVVSELVTSATTAVFKDIGPLLRRSTISYGNVTVGTVTRTADGAVVTAAESAGGKITDDVAKAATHATDRLRDTSAAVHAAASSKLRGNPTSVRGLSDEIVAKLKAEIPGTIAIGSDEAVRLVSGKGRVIYRRPSTERVNAPQAQFSIFRDGQGVELFVAGNGAMPAGGAGLRRIVVTDPLNHSGFHRAEDAIVGVGHHENQALAETLADRIIIEGNFKGIHGDREIEAQVQTAVQSVLRRAAGGRSLDVTLTFICDSTSASVIRSRASSSLARIRRTTPEAAHLTLEFLSS